MNRTRCWAHSGPPDHCFSGPLTGTGRKRGSFACNLHTAAENEPRFPTTSTLHCFCLERDLPTHTAIPQSPRGGVVSPRHLSGAVDSPLPAEPPLRGDLSLRTSFLWSSQELPRPSQLKPAEQGKAGAGGSTGPARQTPKRATWHARELSVSPGTLDSWPGQSDHQAWAGRQALPQESPPLLQATVSPRDPRPAPPVCLPCVQARAGQAAPLLARCSAAQSGTGRPGGSRARRAARKLAPQVGVQGYCGRGLGSLRTRPGEGPV